MTSSNKPKLCVEINITMGLCDGEVKFLEESVGPMWFPKNRTNYNTDYTEQIAAK